jgi:DNA-binding response OmpR family regulator
VPTGRRRTIGVVTDLPGSRAKLLVVDDDPVARQLLDVRLRESGYDVAFAVDASSALEQARAESPDLIVLDLGLPGGNGILVLDQLRRVDALANIPVVVLTANEQARMTAVAAGAAAFVDKAEGLDSLLAAVDGQLAS